MPYLEFAQHWWRTQTGVSGSVSLNMCKMWTTIKLFVFYKTSYCILTSGNWVICKDTLIQSQVHVTPLHGKVTPHKILSLQQLCNFWAFTPCSQFLLTPLFHHTGVIWIFQFKKQFFWKSKIICNLSSIYIKIQCITQEIPSVPQ